MNEPFLRIRRSWPTKIAAALKGCVIGTRGHNSFAIHLPAAVLVFAAAAFFRVSTIEWCVLIGCVTAVLAAELFNSAIETLARAVTPYKSEHVSQALDIASGAVLITSLGAAAVGAAIFLPRCL